MVGVFHLNGGYGKLNLKTRAFCVLDAFPGNCNIFTAEAYGDCKNGILYILSDGFINDFTVMIVREYAVFFIIGFILCTPIAKRFNKLCVDGKMKLVSKCAVIVYPIVLMILFLISISYLVIGSYNPFIYFNF